MPKRKDPAMKHITPMHLRSGQWAYQVRLTIRGQKYSRLHPSLPAAQADRDARIANGLPLANAEGEISKPIEEPPATLDDGLRGRVLDLERRHKDATVTERVRKALAGMADLRGLTLEALEPPDLSRYVRHRERAGIKANTIVRELREWRAMLKRLRPDLRVSKDLFPPENLTRVRVLTEAQEAEVFPELAERHGERFALLSRLAMLGILRLNDVRVLERDHVHLPERLLLLPRTKGGTSRAVYLNDQALLVLERALMLSPDTQRYVFGHPRTGQPYSRVHISRCWRNAARACGLEGFTFHDLRHHGPTRLINEGVTSDVIARAGGWTSPRMVQDRYAKVLDPTVRAAMALIGRSRTPA